MASPVQLHSSLGRWIPNGTRTTSFALQKDSVGIALFSLYNGDFLRDFLTKFSPAPPDFLFFALFKLMGNRK